MNQRHDVPPALLAKVRKILTKAEDPATTPEEAELYTAKAAELIATYGIDQALLAESRPGTDVIGDRVVVLEAPYALDKARTTYPAIQSRFVSGDCRSSTSMASVRQSLLGGPASRRR